MAKPQTQFWLPFIKDRFTNCNHNTKQLKKSVKNNNNDKKRTTLNPNFNTRAHSSQAPTHPKPKPYLQVGLVTPIKRLQDLSPNLQLHTTP